MADVKVPKLLHKMSLASQKAWYKKQGMEMPSATKPAEGEGKSAAAAKKVRVAPRKAVEIKPGSIRAINQARQDAYKGRQPIGATGSGGHSVMAGSNMSTAKGIIAGIKAGYNPRVSLNPYEGLTAKEKKAMKSEEVEQIDEISLDLIRKATQKAGYKAADHEAAAQDRADAGARAGDPEERAHLQAAKAYRAQQDRLRSAILARKAKQFAKPLVSKAKLTKVNPKRVREEVEQLDEISLNLISKAMRHAGYKAADHEAAAQDRVDAGARVGDPEEKAHTQAAQAYRDQQDRLRDAIHARKAKQFAKPLVSKAKLAKMKRKRVREEVEQIDEAKMTDAHKKIAKQVHRALSSDDQQVSQAYGFRVKQMHNLIRKKYGSNWRSLAGINEEVAETEKVQVSKAEAEKVLGGPVSKRPKMPPGKQPAGYRYVRGLARRAMKAGMKKEEAEQVDEARLPHVATFVPLKRHIENKSLRDAIHIPVNVAHGDKSHKEKLVKKIGAEKAAMYKLHGVFPRKIDEEVEQVDEIVAETNYRRPSMREIDDALDAERKGNPEPANKLRDIMRARKSAQAQSATRPAQKFPVYEPGRRYVGDSVELDGPVIDEANSRNKEDTEMKYIEEKLTAADPASKWISDFVKSDNPKFAGKSKKERIQQALGAYYAAKGGKNEEVEQVDEFVDRETRLAARKAETGSSTRVSSGDVLGRRGGHETPKQAIARRVGKDSYGIKSGGKTSIYNRLPKPNLPEEAEQIDEISPGLARKAAAASQVKAIEFSDYSGLSNLYNKEGKKEANRLNRKSDKAMDYIEKRQGQKGVDKVNRMVTRVVGEEVGGKTPETDTEVSLAKMHGNPKKITYGDVVKARIASAKKKALNKG